jgi:hypothetical protein
VILLLRQPAKLLQVRVLSLEFNVQDCVFLCVYVSFIGTPAGSGEVVPDAHGSGDADADAHGSGDADADAHGSGDADADVPAADGSGDAESDADVPDADGSGDADAHGSATPGAHTISIV